MSKFHATVRDLLEDIYSFLAVTVQNEALSNPSQNHREKLLNQLSIFQKEYPELQLNFSLKLPIGEIRCDKTDSSRHSPSSPVSYVDMNGGNSCKIPTFQINASDDSSSYDYFTTKEKSESHSIAESEDYLSDDAKNVPYVAASELALCDKAGYLDKKKRDSLKGWLNPYQKRWCAIKDGVLYYFEKPTDRKQRGSIILSGYEARQVVDDGNEGKKYNHCFELVCPGKRTYQFSACSEKDMQQWIAAVEKSCYLSKPVTPCQSNMSASNCSANKAPDLDDQVDDDIYETVQEEVEKLQTPDDKAEESTFENEDYSDVDTAPQQNEMFNYNEWYVGLWDCSSADDSELSFVRGDLIHIISKEYDSYAWWIGELQGKVGFVPKSYLMEAYEAC